MAKRSATSGSYEELLADCSDEVRAIADLLKKQILRVHGDAVQVVRLGDGAVTFGVGPKKMREGYCYLAPHGDRINFGFYQGVSLSDPEGLLEGSGKAMRHVKVSTAKLARSKAVAALIAGAVAERRRALAESKSGAGPRRRGPT
jgi:hypothetical protein